jgi:hypothetical protein
MLELLDVLAYQILLYRDYANKEEANIESQNIMKRETSHYKQVLDGELKKDTVTKALLEKDKYYSLLRYIVAYHSELIEDKNQVLGILLEGAKTKESPYKDITMSNLKLDDFTISSILEGLEKSEENQIDPYYYLLKRNDLTLEQRKEVATLAIQKNHTKENMLSLQKENKNQETETKINVSYQLAETNIKNV